MGFIDQLITWWHHPVWQGFPHENRINNPCNCGWKNPLLNKKIFDPEENRQLSGNRELFFQAPVWKMPLGRHVLLEPGGYIHVYPWL